MTNIWRNQKNQYFDVEQWELVNTYIFFFVWLFASLTNWITKCLKATHKHTQFDLATIFVVEFILFSSCLMIFRLYNLCFHFYSLFFIPLRRRIFFSFKHSGFFVDFGAGMRERKNKFQMVFLIAPLLLKNCAFTVRQRCAKEKIFRHWTWVDENSQSLHIMRMRQQHRTWKNWSKVGMTTAIEKRFPIPQFWTNETLQNVRWWTVKKATVSYITAAFVLFNEHDSISMLFCMENRFIFRRVSNSP